MVDIPQQVTIKAPCRIHLGLLSIQENEGRKFGGAGVMLENPALELTARRAEVNECTGPLASRASRFVELWRKHSGNNTPFHLDIRLAPPEHVGLGLGTQLGMSVATSLDILTDRQDLPLEQRAESVGRGLRSAVGAYGFGLGGLIAENGKCSGEQLGLLKSHVVLPSEWHVMLVRMNDARGLAGDVEIEAFRTLSNATLQPQTQTLRDILYRDLVPAAQADDFELFSDAVFRYGIKAGEMFAESQGGPFLNQSIAAFVDYCRKHGVQGVGQSSWGPTIFCWFRNKTSADNFHQEHIACKPNLDADVTVTAVSDGGAVIQTG